MDVNRCWVLAAVMLWPMVGHAEKRHHRKGHHKRVYVRGVVGHVDPRVSAHDLQVEASGVAAGAIGDGSIDNSGVTVNASSMPMPTAIVGYVVPGLRGRLSVETMVGAPVGLKIEATGKLANESLAPEAAGVPTGIPPLGRELGEAMIAPPMVTAIYRPLQIGRVGVFAGTGVSVLFVYDERVTNPVLTEVSEPSMTISHAFGAVLQAGLEARVWRRFVARFDAKYIAYRDSHATIDNIQVRTSIPLLPTVEVGSASMDVSARPVIVQVGLGADF
jgi:outer membrane protein W